MKISRLMTAHSLLKKKKKEPVGLKLQQFELLVFEICPQNSQKIRSTWGVFYRVAKRLDRMHREPENWGSIKQKGKNTMDRILRIALNLQINFRCSSMNQGNVKHQKDKTLHCERDACLNISNWVETRKYLGGKWEVQVTCRPKVPDPTGQEEFSYICFRRPRKTQLQCCFQQN